jgi:hypothetical protein
MKKFLGENWYKLMIGSSLLMFSFGFMVQSISPAFADNYDDKINKFYRNNDGSINVRLSDDQLNKIIPKNADGSLNVKLINDAPMEINLTEIRGYPVAYKSINGARGLFVSNHNDAPLEVNLTEIRGLPAAYKSVNGGRGLFVAQCEGTYNCD